MCSADGLCLERPASGVGGYSYVFGTSSTDVWIVGDDVIFEWDGTGWHDRSSTATPRGYGIVNGPEELWGTNPTRLWGVSWLGIWRWDGTGWSLPFTEWSLTAISGRPRTTSGRWARTA